MPTAMILFSNSSARERTKGSTFSSTCYVISPHREFRLLFLFEPEMVSRLWILKERDSPFHRVLSLMTIQSLGSRRILCVRMVRLSLNCMFPSQTTPTWNSRQRHGRMIHWGSFWSGVPVLREYLRSERRMNSQSLLMVWKPKCEPP